MTNRSEIITLLANARFAFQSEATLKIAYINSTDFQKTLSDHTDAEKRIMTREEFEIQYQYCTNAFLAEVYRAIYGEPIKVTGVIPNLFPCPCCGLMTLPTAASPSWDDCGYCNWMDDGTEDRLYSSQHNKQFKHMEDCLERANMAVDARLRERWYSKDTLLED